MKTERPEEAFHGSDLEKIELAYGIPKEDIVSFSANVNPLGISSLLREKLPSHIDAIAAYPDREYRSLRSAIGQYVHAPADHILVGNGTTELISLFIQAQAPKTALILEPTYSEYEREISLAGGQCRYFPLKEEEGFQLNLDRLLKALSPDVDLLVLCNPNNPTSSPITRPQMEEILDVCRKSHIFVMVDETYVEFAENVDEITAAPLASSYGNLLVLRGFSKFFAAPGLRLGYGVCGSPELLQAISQKQNPWSVNSLAAIAGEIMLSDEAYKKDTRQLIGTERQRICRRLSLCPHLKLYPASANFVFLKILKESVTSKDLFECAIQKGLMIRDCSTFPFLSGQYVRLCFMMPEQNDRLADALLERLESS